MSMKKLITNLEEAKSGKSKNRNIVFPVSEAMKMLKYGLQQDDSREMVVAISVALTNLNSALDEIKRDEVVSQNRSAMADLKKAIDSQESASRSLALVGHALKL